MKFFQAACILFLFFLNTCAEKKQGDAELLRDFLYKYFDIPFNVSEAHIGLFKADSESFKELIRKNFLNNYIAKPDEASKKIIEDRMKKTDCFLKLEKNNSVSMLTISPDGFPGINNGQYKLVSKTDLKMVLFGKNDSVNANADIRPDGDLLYSDPHGKLLFHRIEAKPAILADYYYQQFQQHQKESDY